MLLFVNIFWNHVCQITMETMSSFFSWFCWGLAKMGFRIHGWKFLEYSSKFLRASKSVASEKSGKGEGWKSEDILKWKIYGNQKLSDFYEDWRKFANSDEDSRRLPNIPIFRKIAKNQRRFYKIPEYSSKFPEIEEKFQKTVESWTKFSDPPKFFKPITNRASPLELAIPQTKKIGLSVEYENLIM